MKKLLLTLSIMFTALAGAQTGTIDGALTDEDANNEPLAFASVVIKGTSKGAQTDFDGNYSITDIPVGVYEVEFSFVGYKTVVISNVQVEDGKFTKINAALGGDAAQLSEVFIRVQTSRERESALLLEQKKAVEIKESIGAQQLTKLGISDAAGATAKISGVSKTEGSGDVFVRGLGDRYLSTTLNGLPIPSDDIERKNIDLSLFPTRLIQSIDVSKTTSPRLSADQSSGNIDINSKELSGSKVLSGSVSTSVNTNVLKDGGFSNFQVSPNQDQVTAGIYVKDQTASEAITGQSWNPTTESAPINRSVSITAGRKIGEKFKVLFTAGQSSNFEYRNGVFRQFRSNFIDDTITDAITWKKTIATSGLLHAQYKVNDNNTIKFNTLAISKVEDQVFEGGRDGKSTIFEETDEGETAEDGNVFFQFIRDQNLKKTFLSVTQFSGEHKIGAKNELEWATGYNYLSADEPIRIRNEVNFTENTVQLGRNGGFQQRKSAQKIEDVEYNGRISDLFKIVDTDTDLFHINLGANFRNKERKFGSQFFGVQETLTNAINPTSIDNISDIFTPSNFDNNLLERNTLEPDFYQGELQSVAGFANFTGQKGQFTVQAGVRVQKDNIDVDFDVNNFPGRTGSINKEYNRLYPSFNLKYALNEKHSFRFANSFTTTLPEFKEIAPFEYVSPQGQVTRGNPNVEASQNINFDLKWEFFPSNNQLISATAFYKNIEDPITRVQDRGSAGVFSYFNAGEKAEIYGIEIEGRVNLIPKDDEKHNLKLNVNASRMWHEQDLKENRDEAGNLLRTFRYNNQTEVGLQGASDWIFNTSVNYSTKEDNPFEATLSGNFASDKIFALGSPENQTNPDLFYNEAIVEKGFVTLNLIISKRFGEHWKVGFNGRNLLNPEIKRTQLNKPSTTNIETEETVLSYTRGMQLGVNLNYTF